MFINTKARKYHSSPAGGALSQFEFCSHAISYLVQLDCFSLMSAMPLHWLIVVI